MLSNAVVVVKVISFYLSIVVEISELAGEEEQQQFVYVRTCDQTPVRRAEGISKRQHWEGGVHAGIGLAKDGAWHHLSFPSIGSIMISRSRTLANHPSKPLTACTIKLISY